MERRSALLSNGDQSDVIAGHLKRQAVRKASQLEPAHIDVHSGPARPRGRPPRDQRFGPADLGLEVLAKHRAALLVPLCRSRQLGACVGVVTDLHRPVRARRRWAISAWTSSASTKATLPSATSRALRSISAAQRASARGSASSASRLAMRSCASDARSAEGRHADHPGVCVCRCFSTNSTSVATTLIYTHVSVGHLKETLKRCHPRERGILQAKDKDDEPDGRRDS